MTIFLIVLKNLIKEQLNATASELASQAGYPMVYDQLLSLEKKAIISDLEVAISDFKGTGHDENDAKFIVKKIEEYRVLVQDKQEGHGKERDKGETVTTLSNLIFHTNSFYAKLAGFNKLNIDEKMKLCLVNKPYHKTPENIIYYHAAYYLAEEIFKPSGSKDLATRGEKESAIFKRLQSLSERIKPEFGLEARKDRALEALQDLATDNLSIINPKSSGGYSLPFFSIGGMVSLKLPTDWFNPREGRFSQQFSLALSLVKGMTSATFEAPLSADEVKIDGEEVRDDSHHENAM